MQRRRQGFTTTFLMLIPMLGVPAMAIFGIPQFAPLISSMTSHADEPDLDVFHETRLGQSASGSLRTLDLPAVEQVDLFQPYESDAATRQPATQRSETVMWTDPLRRAELRSQPVAAPPATVSHRESSVRASRRMHQQVYDIFADDFRDPSNAAPAASTSSTMVGRTRTVALNEPAEPTSPAGVLNWRDAIDRLKACGSTSYRLTAGARDGDYLFVCLVASPDDERITRRFEAESSDPLVAVENVLGQIDVWRR